MSIKLSADSQAIFFVFLIAGICAVGFGSYCLTLLMF